MKTLALLVLFLLCYGLTIFQDAQHPNIRFDELPAWQQGLATATILGTLWAGYRLFQELFHKFAVLTGIRKAPYELYAAAVGGDRKAAEQLRDFEYVERFGADGWYYRAKWSSEQNDGWTAEQSTSDFKVAAMHGSLEAQCEYGHRLRFGYGTDEDLPEAAEWLGKAASRGFALAQVNLGRMYGEGAGVPKDIVAAYKWLNLAAAQESGEISNIAKQERDSLEQGMSPDQVAEAQRLSREWKRA